MRSRLLTATYERMDKPTKCAECKREVAVVRENHDEYWLLVSRHFRGNGFCSGSFVRMLKA